MQIQRFLLLLTLPLLISLSACIAFPTEMGDEELFEDKQLAFIEIGKSTKEEIAAAMSDYLMENDESEVRVNLTPEKFRDGDWWLYAQTREELKWVIVGSGPSGQGGDMDFGDVDYRFLLIKFDNKGIVAEYELSLSEGYGCNRYGVCIGRSNYKQLLASEDDDRDVKQFTIPDDRCGIYVYGIPKCCAPAWSEVPIWLDGHQVGLLLDKKQFFFWQVDQGAHHLAPHRPGASVPWAVEFSCDAGGVYFFELERKKKRVGLFSVNRWIEIEQRDAMNGRKAIDKRKLTLNIAEPSD